jgi:hypothetical protein
MTFKQWLRKAFGPWVRNSRASRRGKSRQPRHRCVPRLEWLEDRLAPAILMVNSVADSGAGTLRDAILSSVNHTGGGTGNDTIRFSATLDGGTISLSTSINDATVAGPSAFLIGKSDTLVIDGETGLTQGITITRSGTTPFRIFDVDATSNLTLEGLTLSGGDAQGFDGGGSGQPGGGSAGLGGAIFNQGSLTILDSTLTGNTAQGGKGGPIAVRDTGGGGAGLGGAGGSSPLLMGPGGGGGGPNGGGGGYIYLGDIIYGTDHLSGGNGQFGGGGGGGGAYGPFVGDGGAGGFGGGGGGGGTGISVDADTGAVSFYGGNGGNGGFVGGGGVEGFDDNVSNPGLGGFGGGNASDGNAGGGAGMGGAVFNEAGTVVITNSTFTGNKALGGTATNGTSSGQGLGGGLFGYSGSVTITNSTFSLNTAAQGGRGIFLFGTSTPLTADINNTIIGQSDTTVSDLAVDTTADGSGTVLGKGNLIRTTTVFGAPLNLLDALTADPKLGPLQNYGGWTQTLALASNSPAIDAGTASGAPATDQRGLSRDGPVDIGAYERQSQTVTFGSLANRTYGDADFTISATVTSPLPVSFTSSDNAIASVSQDPVTGVWTVHITGAGSATITAHQAGDTYLYNAAPDVAQSLTIAKATPTVMVSDAGGNFTGSAYPATGSVTGVNKTDLGTPTFQYYLASDTLFANPLPGAPTKVGSYVVVASYAATANYASASASTSFSILSAQQQAVLLTGQINTLVNTGVLNSGNGNALTTKLSNAAGFFAAGKTKDGIHQVGDFIHQVDNDVKSGKLTATQAQPLISAANAIIASASPFVLVSSVGNTITAGTPFNLTITVVDLNGNVVPTYTGMVQFTDSVAGATLPANYTFTTGSGKDNGVHTFTGLVLNTKGSQTLTVTDAKTGQVLGTLTVNVV